MDPMYNFDTHFPERLSRLHVHGDTFAAPQNSFRKKKNSRANRNAARYKTQPVTFAEILEVDEEPITSTGVSAVKPAAEKRFSHLDERQFNMNQLQAFSKSLDGLVPVNTASALPEHFKPNVMLARSGSFSRTGSRKYLRHPECIPEKVESESQPKSPKSPPAQQQQQPKPEGGEQRLAESGSPPGGGLSGGGTAVGGESSKPAAQLEVATDSMSPALSPLAAPRRQKMTAKAKKRQKAQGEGEGS